MNKKTLALIILDGYGLNPEHLGNAVYMANTPNLDRYYSEYPNSRLSASGMDVGLPDGQMGNSEVGHTNIGAGRVVYQDLTKITKSILDGDFFQKKEFLGAVENCRNNNSALHLMGLLSDGGVHSHNTHLYALLDLAKAQGLKDVYIHCFFDGRDVPPDSSIDYIRQLEEQIKIKGIGKIATIMGRFYAMDRDTMWERVELAYNAMVMGTGNTAESAEEGVLESYGRKVFDEFVRPCVILENGKPTAVIKENDSIIFFNFRPDRAREITRTFIKKDFSEFNRKKGWFPIHYVCMSQYDETFDEAEVAYESDDLSNTFGEYISVKGLTQLRIAETTKYAHVTFFFNGGVENVFKNEDRALIKTPEIETFDLQPEMSAYEVTDEAIKRIKSGRYDVMILNFANCDMVGHTGVIPAAVKAVEAVDDCLGKVIDALIETGGKALVTADHGNAEEMLTKDGKVITAHSTNPVPIIAIGLGDVKVREGILADLAPTMLDILKLEKPMEMTGTSLIVRG
jgi:2,3-bisphosphoglycerate-independent phosphoglycerate mutase